MKALFAIAIICLSMTANGLIYPRINKSDSTEQGRFGHETSEPEALAGVIRGYLKALGDKDPLGDSIACLDKETSIAIYNHISGLALVASTSSRANIAGEVAKYLRTVGNRIYENLNDKVVKCFVNSRDFAHALSNLGLSPVSPKFADGFVQYLVKAPGVFQTVHSNVYNALNSGAYEVAGQFLANYQKSVAKTALMA